MKARLAAARAEQQSVLHKRNAPMAAFDANDPDATRKMRELFGPGQLDQLIRQAFQVGRMILPEGRRTVDELEKQLRRVIDRVQGFARGRQTVRPGHIGQVQAVGPKYRMENTITRRSSSLTM